MRRRGNPVCTAPKELVADKIYSSNPYTLSERTLIMPYYTYILANKPKGTLYVGVTNNLERRISEHKEKLGSTFTKKYNIHMLVYLEEYSNPNDAIAREK